MDAPAVVEQIKRTYASATRYRDTGTTTWRTSSSDIQHVSRFETHGFDLFNWCVHFDEAVP